MRLTGRIFTAMLSSMSTRSTETLSADHMQTHEESEAGPISLSHIASIFRRYSGVILVTLASVLLGYLIVATAIYLLAERQRTTSLKFRLEFKGASQGEYPNGLKFSVADTP